MIKNIEAAEALVQEYKDIVWSEDRELEDIDALYTNYGEYLSDITRFNSNCCSLCVSVRDNQAKTHCSKCIWSLCKNGSKDFKRLELDKPNGTKRYCINKNYEDVELSIYLEDFKEALGKRIDKLEQLIKKAKQLNKEEENENSIIHS